MDKEGKTLLKVFLFLSHQFLLSNDLSIFSPLLSFFLPISLSLIRIFLLSLSLFVASSYSFYLKLSLTVSSYLLPRRFFFLSSFSPLLSPRSIIFSASPHWQGLQTVPRFVPLLFLHAAWHQWRRPHPVLSRLSC